MPSTTATRASSRGASNARTEIIEVLKEDHKRAQKAFRIFNKLDPEQDSEQCEAIVQQTCAELTVHATLEEECFYGQVRQALEADLIDEAEVEHQSAKDLIAKLEQMSAGDDKFGATFTVLGEYIKHHVKAEEGEMFPQLGRARLDWASMLERIKTRRAELMQRHMPEEEADAELQDKDEFAEAPTATATTAAPAATRAGSAGQRGGQPQPAKSAAGRKPDEE